MVVRRPSNVTSAKPWRCPPARISSVKKPPRRHSCIPVATARITVVLPTPGGPVRRSRTAEALLGVALIGVGQAQVEHNWPRESALIARVHPQGQRRDVWLSRALSTVVSRD